MTMTMTMCISCLISLPGHLATVQGSEVHPVTEVWAGCYSSTSSAQMNDAASQKRRTASSIQAQLTATSHVEKRHDR